MKAILAILALILASAPAQAVAPPSPSPAALEVARSYVRSLMNKDYAAYGAILSDSFVGYTAADTAPKNRDKWLSVVANIFNKNGPKIRILHSHYTLDHLNDKPVAKILLIESVSTYVRSETPIEYCCTYVRTEMLIVDDSKVIQIERSDYLSELPEVSG